MKSKTVTAVAAAGFVGLAHLSGAARGLEREFSPGLAKASFNLFHIAAEEVGSPAARAAITETLKGSPAEQAAARAACAVLNAGIQGSQSQQAWELHIRDQIPDLQESLPGVDQAVTFLSTRLVGVTEYHQLWVYACHGKF